MRKKNYIVIGSVLLGALIAGLVFGWGIDIMGDGLARTKVVDVSENISPAARSGKRVNRTDYYQDAIIHYSSILKKEPQNLEAITKLANIYFGMNNYNNAIKYYNKAVKLAPNDASYYNNLGLSYHYMDRSQQGLKLIEDGIKVDPYHQRIWLTRGFILATTGNVTEAIKAWDRAHTLNSESEVGKAALDFLSQYRPISTLQTMQPENNKP